MSNLPTPYNGDFPEENIDLNLLYIDNAIDVATNPNNVIINNGLYTNTIDSKGSVPMTIGGTNASSITIGKLGITTTVVGLLSGSSVTLSSMTSGGESLLAPTSANPNFRTKGLKAGTGTTFGVTDTDITINGSLAITLASTGAGTSLLNSTTSPDFSTKSLNVGGNGLTISNTTTDITISLPTTATPTITELTVNSNINISGIVNALNSSGVALRVDGTINGNLYPSTALLAVGSSVTPWLSADITTVLSTTNLIRNGATNTTLLTTAASSTGVVMKLPPVIGTAGQVLSTDGAGNCSWATPSNSGSVLTTKGDIYVAGVGGVVSRLPVGSNGSYLLVDSASALGVRWSTFESIVRLIATNVPNPTQVELQAYYDNAGGNAAPDTVPDGVITADTGTIGYTVYLGHNTWSYRQNSSGIWNAFTSGGKSSFSAPVAKLYTYK
jgi:hypothetical protein